MSKPIKQDRIDRCLQLIKDFKTLITLGNGLVNRKDFYKLCNKQKLSYSIFESFINLGFITKTDNLIKFNLGIIEPIHARRILEDHNKHAYAKRLEWFKNKGVTESEYNKDVHSNFSKKKKEKKKIVKIVEPKIPIDRNTVIQIPLPPREEHKIVLPIEKRKKTFSFLWGLIKFDY